MSRNLGEPIPRHIMVAIAIAQRMAGLIHFLCPWNVSRHLQSWTSAVPAKQLISRSRKSCFHTEERFCRLLQARKCSKLKCQIKYWQSKQRNLTPVAVPPRPQTRALCSSAISVIQPTTGFPCALFWTPASRKIHILGDSPRRKPPSFSCWTLSG